MVAMALTSPLKRCPRPLTALALALAAAAAGAPLARAAADTQLAAAPKLPLVSVSLAQCAPAATQPERSATFAGEMNTIPGATHMEIRIEVLERLPAQPEFHTVAAPGLGDWRVSVAGVRVYKYLKQVTNLSAPAEYRAAVHFRWLNAKARIMRVAQMRTPVCVQQAPELASPVPGGEAPAPLA